ncbi:peptidoglycan bridge formation glycyltransferase FemA/FemB family protein [Candidatus Saccharibacteria bacterium]|nr:peptidoglycan bridge formation glycyltransferase FemA/FemB family protein [Candidatus Saccharibacteria bacterium]
MEFITLESEKFRKFADKYPDKSFYQTPEIAELRAENGWTPYYFGVEENGKLKAASLVVARPAFLGKSIYYTPGGPLIDYEDEALTNFFFKNLKNYAKSHNGYILHIEPYYEKIARDRGGEPIPDGFNRQKALLNLRKIGFATLKQSDEPKYSFAMELKDQTVDKIFADMKRNTRNHIRKAEKMGVKIRELKREELGIFKQITESTSKRRNFTDKPLSYYEKMYDLFHDRGEVKFIIAEVKLEENSSLTPLSAAMFITYGDEVIYLFSGSDEQYMKDYNAQYLIQWHMIKYAIENGFKRYNFYGIQGLPDKTSKDYGIYDFKKGFTSPETGRVIELLGAHELPVNSFFYNLHHLLNKLKHH